jgi:hypothetical protein
VRVLVMIAWLHTHALMAVALAFVAGANVGILMMSVFLSGREAPVVTPDVVRLNGVRLDLTHAASVTAARIRQRELDNRRLNYAGGRGHWPDGSLDVMEQDRV